MHFRAPIGTLRTVIASLLDQLARLSGPDVQLLTVVGLFGVYAAIVAVHIQRQATPREAPPGAPWWVQLGIAAFVLLQVAMPLRYYLSDERYDERFAWRMFSPVRATTCQVAFYDRRGGNQDRIKLHEDVHVVWVNLMKRARMGVIEAYARHFCAQAPDRDLRADLTCKHPDAMDRLTCTGRLPPSCRGLDAAACRTKECGDEPPAVCEARICRVEVLNQERSLCEGLR